MQACTDLGDLGDVSEVHKEFWVAVRIGIQSLVRSNTILINALGWIERWLSRVVCGSGLPTINFSK